MHPLFEKLREKRISDLERTIDCFYYRLTRDLEKARKKGTDGYENLFNEGLRKLLNYYDSLSQLKELKPIKLSDTTLERLTRSTPESTKPKGLFPTDGDWSVIVPLRRSTG